MPFSVGNVVQFIWEIWENTEGSVFENRFNYRIHSGETSDADWVNCITAFKEGVYDHFQDILLSTAGLQKIRMKVIAPTKSPMYEKSYDWNPNKGSLTLADELIQSWPHNMAICYTPKNFLPGRKGIGHKYIGPTSPDYSQNGKVIIDPSTAPSLLDYAGYFQAPITMPSASVWHPIVCSNAGTGVDAKNDVRDVSVAPLCTFMRSRRFGVGM